MRIVFVHLILLVYGCSPKTDGNIRLGDNDYIQNIIVVEPQKLPLDSVFSEIGFFKLDTISKAYMVMPGDLRVFNGHSYILDYGSNSVLMFDMSGKFIRKIGTLGRGPRELLTIKSLTVDYLRNRLYLVDNSGAKCAAYDADGNYQFTVPLGDPGGYIAITKDGNLVHESQSSWFGYDLKKNIQKENIKILDSLGNVLNFGFDYNYNRKINCVFETISVNQLNEVTFEPMFKNLIYSVTESEIKPLYSFDFSKVKELTKGMSDKYQDATGLMSDARLGYAFLSGKHLDTPNVLYAMIGFGLNKSHLFYDKNDSTSVVLPNLSEKQYSIIPDFFFDYYDGYFYGILTGVNVQLLRKANLREGSIEKAVMDQVVEGEDNNFIIYFKLKNDL